MAALASAAMWLAGCGTVVPTIQEASVRSVDSVNLVRGVTMSVQCELRDAVNEVIDDDIEVNKGVREAAWFDRWGVQVGLTLAVEEKSSLSPNLSWTRPEPLSRLLTIGGGVSGSTSAARTDKLSYFFTVKDLRKLGYCSKKLTEGLPGGSLLIRNDLKTAEWLRSHLLSAGTSAIPVPVTPNTPAKQNALSHEVKFQVVTSGSVTPSLKLTNTSFNPAAPLFSTSRDRTHYLIFTFGPIDPSLEQLAPIANQAYLASQINSVLYTRRDGGF